jgi:phage baseplate assembly protein W
MEMGLNIKGDIAKKLDVNAIKQSVKNIVLTPKKPFQPNFGPRISYALFNMDNPFERALLKDEIEVALKKHEKRIHSIKVEFSGSIDANEMVVNISFQIVNVVGRYDVDVVLQKIR